MNSLIGQLIEESQRGQVKWLATSSPFTFETEYQGIIYTIHAKPIDLEEEMVTLYSWNDDGESHPITLCDEEKRQCFQLLQTVFQTNMSLRMNYTKYTKKMEKNNTISLYKIKRRLGFDTEDSHPHIHIKESEYFYYAQMDVSKYIDPIMKQIETVEGFTPFHEANVILISAPGATGKTVMSEYLSKTLQIPILNLSKYDAVGANSIGGLIMKEVESQDIFVYHQGLKDGTCSLIIDGLDEAAIHITHESFEAFMKDIAFFSKDSKGLPFVILGRPAVMENAALSLEENQVKTTLLQIEPFTIEKAKEFIDAQTTVSARSRFDLHYRSVRDYIIDEIGGFFRNESDINHLVFERFIGYAPVLVSIKTLLSIEKDYHRLLQELQRDKKQKIGLLVDVIEKILDREQLKIHEGVLEQFFDHTRNQEVRDAIRAKCGTKEDQCCRLIDYLLGEESFTPLFNDDNLDIQYNQKINEWLENHPFVNATEKRFENIVFESYVIAYLSNTLDYKDKAIRAMERSKGSSYLFLYLFDSMSESKDISIQMVPYLISSFKALDRPLDIGMIEIFSSDEADAQNIQCEMSFGRENTNKEYEFTFTAHRQDELYLPSPLSSMNIDAPLNICMKGLSIELQSPLSICCYSLDIISKEALITDNQGKTGIVIDSEHMSISSADGSPTLLTNRIHNGSSMKIFTSSTLPYPFSEYKETYQFVLQNDKEISEAFTKFRRMILMFRSHSKGALARYCSKIDNRIAKTNTGRLLLKKLLEEKVIYTDQTYYYINYERFASVIGVKYDEIRSCNINEKTRLFLSNAIKG